MHQHVEHVELISVMIAVVHFRRDDHHVACAYFIAFMIGVMHPFAVDGDVDFVKVVGVHIDIIIFMAEGACEF